MSEITLYIAASLDGYVAEKDGSIAWLENIPNPDKNDYGYNAFINSIDTVVMGRHTYEIVTGFDMDWPYGQQHTVVVSSDREFPIKTPNTTILSTLNRSAIEKLRAQSQSGIWLVGGGQLLTSFLKLDAVDRIILFIMPVILGTGIRLFPRKVPFRSFHLESSEPYTSGVVRMTYIKAT